MDPPDGTSRDLIIRFIESQLKTGFCPKFVHKSTYVFEKSMGDELPDDKHYVWPSKRLHSNARNAHRLLKIRCPVPDEMVMIQNRCPELEGYQPNRATDYEDLDAAHYNTVTNPQGRLGWLVYFFFVDAVLIGVVLQHWPDGKRRAGCVGQELRL
jgi:hypothetical protein